MTGNVSVGVTTRAGYGVTALGLIGAVLALVLPDVPQQQLAVIASAALTLGSLGVTQVFRYLQALELARHEPIPTVNVPVTWTPTNAPSVAAQRDDVAAPYMAGTTTTAPRPSVDLVPVDLPEPGDPDALPDYATTTTVPPDEGDRKP